MAYQVQPAITGSGLAGSGRPYTAELWDGYDPAAMLRNPGLGHFYQTDFVGDCPVIPTNQTVANFGNWNGITGATAATVGPSAIMGGVCELTSSTDDMDTHLQLGPIGNRPFALVTSNEVTAWPYHHLARVRFECRMALSTIAAESMGWFIGLSGVIAATDLDDDTGDVVTTKPFFGWSALCTTPFTPRFIYQNATAAPTVAIANCGTMAANTWYRLGFDFDPMAPTSQRVSIWFNGVKSSTFITHGATATNFPRTIDGSAAVDLAPSFLRRNGASVAASLYISNFRICQEVVGVSQGNEACG